MRPKRHLSVDDKHRKRLCIIPEFMRHYGEHKRWNEHLPDYYCTLHARIAPLKIGIKIIRYPCTGAGCRRFCLFLPAGNTPHCRSAETDLARYTKVLKFQKVNRHQMATMANRLVSGKQQGEKKKKVLRRKRKTPPKRGSKLVGERGFEPPTHWSQTSCATKLRYSPMYCFLNF